MPPLRSFMTGKSTATGFLCDKSLKELFERSQKMNLLDLRPGLLDTLVTSVEQAMEVCGYLSSSVIEDVNGLTESYQDLIKDFGTTLSQTRMMWNMKNPARMIIRSGRMMRTLHCID